MATKRRPKGAGRVRRLPSGRWQPRFTGPDGVTRSAGITFEAKVDAQAWLRAQSSAVRHQAWTVPTGQMDPDNLRSYAEAWLADRDLKPRTRSQYRKLLDQMILPELGDLPVSALKPTTIRNWHASLSPDTPTWRAHAYSLLRAILTTAVADELLDSNPCKVRGAGAAKRKHRTKIASLPELEVMVEAMPDRYRAMVLLAAWCGLRFGELAELRRGDVHLEDGVLQVERAIVRVDGEVIVGTPKSEAGTRRVAIPPHLLPVVQSHLDEHTDRAKDALLFPAANGSHMAPSSLYKVWYPAREAAGRPDLRFHDLRHTGATLAATTGATLADLMARLGHSTPAAAMRYQHAVQDRDKAIAEALSNMASAKVVPLRKASA